MKKLKVMDQIHVSSVQADALRPGQEITVTNSLGDALLKRHPHAFDDLGDEEEAEAEQSAAEEKAEPAPDNKAEKAAPANKAATARKGTKG